MPRRGRDHALEYQRRIERGLEKGLSRAAARGHGGAPKTARPDRKLLRERDAALSKGLDRIVAGETLSAVAKDSHISREALRRYVGERADVALVKGRLRIVRDRRRVSLPIYTVGTVRRVTMDRENATSAGRFMAAVGRFLETNDAAKLAPFVGEGVVDLSGRRHAFETNPEALYALDARGEAPFHQIYNETQNGE